jgi:hypothetical protein
MIVVCEVYVELAAVEDSGDVRKEAPELRSPAMVVVGATGGRGAERFGGLMGPAIIAVGAERP